MFDDDPKTFALQKEWLPNWRQLSPKNRVESLIQGDNLISKVKSCPAPELLLTLKEYGPGDALPILEALPAHQVQAFLDLDGWQGVRLAPHQIGQWFELLFEANPRKAVKQIRGLDIELVTLLLKLHTSIVPLEEDTQIPKFDQPSYVTPDRRYLVLFSNHTFTEKLGRALKGYIQSLFERETLYALRLIESVRWELPSPLEDEALRFRNARLQDLGYADIEYAGEIFAFRDPDKPIARRVFNSVHDRAALSTFSLSWLGGGAGGEGVAFFGRSSQELDQATLERCQYEATQLANRYLVLSGSELANPQSIQDALVYTLGTVGIALQYQTKNNIEEGAQLLRNATLKELFQIGHSLGIRLASKLRQHIRHFPTHFNPASRARLDAPLDGVIDGLLKSHPLFYQGLVSPKDVISRPFAGLAEIGATAAALNEVIFRKALMQNFHVDQETLSDGLTDASLLATWILLPVDAKDHVAPLPIEDVHVYAQRCQQSPTSIDALLSDERIQQKRQRYDAMVIDIQTSLPHDQRLYERANTFFNQTIAAVHTELKELQTTDIEGKYISSLWVSI